jgi:hypothetical protein
MRTRKRVRKTSRKENRRTRNKCTRKKCTRNKCTRNKCTRNKCTRHRVSRDSIRKIKKQNKTRSKRQKGGGAIAGAVLGLGAAALAYAGFRLVNQVNDKSITMGLLDLPMIDYLPKIKVVETKDFLEQYLQSVTTMQFFTILLENKGFFRSQTILNLVREVSVKQNDIRGDTKIKKLDQLIEKLKEQSQGASEMNAAIENQGGVDELLSYTSQEIPTQPEEKIQPVEESSIPPSSMSGENPSMTPPTTSEPVTSEPVTSEPATSGPEMSGAPSMNPPSNDGPPMSGAPSMAPPPMAPPPMAPPPMAPPPMAPPPMAPSETSAPPSNDEPPLSGAPSTNPPSNDGPPLSGDPSITSPPMAPSETSAPPSNDEPPLSGAPPLGSTNQEGRGYEDMSDSEISEELQEMDSSKKLTINRDIQFSRSLPVKQLERYLLATARFPGYGDSLKEHSGESPIEITPYMTVRGVSWYDDVILKGVYDEDFEASVEALLEERGTLKLMNDDLKKQINRQLLDLREDELLRGCIMSKTKECCTKPRGYMDYIRGNISWDSNNKCLSCPNHDCLIYIYNFYYNFLLHNHPGISVIDKLYMLIVCEARICVFSRCLCLESIRIQDERTGLVEELLGKIYMDDEKKKRLLPQVSEKYSQMFEKVKRGQVGGTLLKPVSDSTGIPDMGPLKKPDSEKISGVSGDNLIKYGEKIGEREGELELQKHELEEEKQKEQQEKVEYEKGLEEMKQSLNQEKAIEKKAIDDKVIAEQNEMKEKTQLEGAVASQKSAEDLQHQEEKILQETQQALAKEKQNELIEKNTIDKQRDEIERAITENTELRKTNQNLLDKTQKQEVQIQKFDQTGDRVTFKQKLKEEMIAKLSDPTLKESVVEIVRGGNPSFEGGADVNMLVDEFLEQNFEKIYVALKPYREGFNTVPFLNMYIENYHVYQFLEPNLIAQRVYMVDPSEGYMDQTFQKLRQVSRDYDKETLSESLNMLPIILLHTDNIDDYPLHSANDQMIKTLSLQKMKPILSKNLGLVAKLISSMKKHDCLMDATLIGDRYLLGKAANKFPEIQDLFQEILRADALKDEKYKGNLVVGVDGSHCKDKHDSIVQSLRQRRPIAVSSKDMMFLTQCQNQKKITRDIDNIRS